MVSLNDYFHTLLDLCQHGVRIASELRFANVERSRIYDDMSLEGMVGPPRLELETSTVLR